MTQQPSSSTSNRLTFHFLYALLFVISAAVLEISVLLELDGTFKRVEHLNPFRVVFTPVYLFFILFTFFHQYAIYGGLYQIEVGIDKWERSTAGWAGTSFEKWFRFFIMLVTLGAVSKGAPLFELMRLLKGIEGLPGHELIRAFTDLGSGNNKLSVFLVLISATFILFVVWSLIALVFVIRSKGLTQKNKKRNIILSATWIISDSLAAIIWACITLGLVYGSYSALIVGSFFIALYIVIFIIRNLHPEIWLVAKENDPILTEESTSQQTAGNREQIAGVDDNGQG